MEAYAALYLPSVTLMNFIFKRPMYEKVVLALGVLVLLVYLLVYLPLLRERRELVQQLESAVEELNEMGYGTTEEAVMENLRRVEDELRILREITLEGHRTLDSDPMIENRIDAPFQYFEFDQERNSVISRLRRTASGEGVEIDDAVIEALPEYVGQAREHLLWAQLALANQVLLGAVENGVDRVESLRFGRIQRVVSDDREVFEEVNLEIGLRGGMDSLNAFLLYLILDAEQIETAGLPEAYPGKRGLFIDRFLLRKEAVDNPDGVVTELVIKSFLRVD